jgi:hypothetical protein
MRRLNAIACFFLVYAEIVIIRKRKGGTPACDISYIIFKRRDNANREGNSITNAYVTQGP